jgi:hypothetical protein
MVLYHQHHERLQFDKPLRLSPIENQLERVFLFDVASVLPPFNRIYVRHHSQAMFMLTKD